MTEQGDTLRQALLRAYLRHVTITYAGGTTRRGYITFAGTLGGQPLIKRRYMGRYGSPLPLDGITRIIEWGNNVLYEAPTD